MGELQYPCACIFRIRKLDCSQYLDGHVTPSTENGHCFHSLGWLSAALAVQGLVTASETQVVQSSAEFPLQPFFMHTHAQVEIADSV